MTKKNEMMLTEFLYALLQESIIDAVEDGDVETLKQIEADYSGIMTEDDKEYIAAMLAA